MLTAVVKACFALVPSGTMRLVNAQPIRGADEHDGGHPMRSVVGARETAPQLQRVDVLFTGHAFGDGTPQVGAKLTVAGDTGLLLDKTLLVCGDQNGGQPQPFRTMRLGYEKSLGGIGFADNPLGTGTGACADEPPNIVSPDDPQGTVGGFGPIPATFPCRKKLLDGLSKQQVEQQVFEIPRNFNWSYLQAAPLDQRLEALHGNEWLSLTHLNAQTPLRTQLPGARGKVHVYGAAAAGAPGDVPLVLDMLHIDGDAEVASLVWRGSFPVMNEQSLGSLVIAGAIELPGQPVSWPADPGQLDAAINATGSMDIRVADDSTTAVYSSEKGGTLPSGPPGAHPLEGTAMIDTSLMAETAVPFPARQPGPETPPSSQRGGLPFAAPPPKTTPPPVVIPARVVGVAPVVADNPFEGTMQMSASDMATATDAKSPFAIAQAGDVAPGGAIPGAPWAGAGPAAADAPDAHPHESTVAVDPQEVAKIRRALERKEKEEKRQAEAAALLERQEVERVEAERIAAERKAEAAGAAKEAEARRQQEAEKFQREQEEAKRAAKARADEEAKKKRERAKNLRTKMYGGFKRKK